MRAGQALFLALLSLCASPSYAQPVEVGVAGTGAVKFGDAAVACDATMEGAIKYVDASNRVELCDDSTWIAVGGDNLGNHTASQNIVLGTNYLSGDGGNEGLKVDSGGVVTIGTTLFGTGGEANVNMQDDGWGNLFVNATEGNGNGNIYFSAGNSNATNAALFYISGFDWEAAAVATLVAENALRLEGDLSPAALGADQNDYNPANLSTASVLRLSASTPINVTGLAGGADGRILTVVNIGSNAITLVDESASSTAANRFALTGNLALATDQSAILIYDSTTSRWRQIANGTATGSGDNLGSHTATANIQLGSYWLSGDGGNEGIQVAADGLATVTNAGENIANFVSTANDVTITLGGPTASTGEKYVTFQNADTGANAWLAGMGDDENFHISYDPAGEINEPGELRIDQSGNIAIAGGLQVGTDFNLINDISPAALGADQNDYNPANLSTASVLRLSASTPINVTGLAGGADGRILAVVNIGANAITLVDESATSTAANRFALTGNLALATDQSAILMYDSTTSRWRQIANGLAAGGSSIGIDALTDAVYDTATDHNLNLGSNTAPAAGAKQNLFIGEGAGSGVTTSAADYNIALGYEALTSLTSGNTNIAVGPNALYQLTNGTDNVAVGGWALNAMNANSGSVAVGTSALTLATGGNNTALGYFAGDAVTTGVKNIVIGYNVDTSAAGASNELNIGNTLYGTGVIDGATKRIGINVPAPVAGLDVGTDIALSGDLSPAALGADQNDYSPANLATASVLRLSASTPVNVTGLAGGADGRVLTVFNVGSNNIVFKNQNASSTAANRFAFGTDITVAAEQSIALIYDATSQRWRAAGLPFDSAAGGGFCFDIWTWRNDYGKWTDVASSGDGTKLVAVGWGEQIYTSTDSGANWTARDSVRDWVDVASSSDGTKLVATVYGGQIYTSTDSGVNWTARNSNRSWGSVASSSDGTKLVATVYGGQIYTSTDSGVNWTARASSQIWSDVASSSDGTRLLAVASDYDNGDEGLAYFSNDSGVTWAVKQTNRHWTGLAMSSDGKKITAGASALNLAGMIYTSDCP